MNHNSEKNWNSLVGQTIVEMIETDDREARGGKMLIFILESGKRYTMYHSKDCCETVYLESGLENKNDIIGSPVLNAEVVSEHGSNDDGTTTYTFYKIATIKGSMTLRWLGESNGYYSEEVDFVLE
jgi:hypothetical protein